MYREIKANLKKLAKEIRKQKIDVKESQRSGECEGQLTLLDMKFEFRHQHFAYCLLRGRTPEQIENNYNEKSPKSKRDDKYIQKILESYKVHKGIEREPSEGPKERLYVVVDENLPRSYQAVQAAHAVAEYMLQEGAKWKNQTLIVLKGSIKKMETLKTYSKEWCCFKEPDLNGKVTAIANANPDNWGKGILRNLELI